MLNLKHKKLKVWKKSISLLKEIYKITRKISTGREIWINKPNASGFDIH